MPLEGDTNFKKLKKAYAKGTELKGKTLGVLGFGRIGQTVSRFLKQEKIDFVAIDIDPLRTRTAREAGENVLFGSSRQTELLKAAHLSKAKLAFGYKLGVNKNRKK